MGGARRRRTRLWRFDAVIPSTLRFWIDAGLLTLENVVPLPHLGSATL